MSTYEHLYYPPLFRSAMHETALSTGWRPHWATQTLCKLGLCFCSISEKTRRAHCKNLLSHAIYIYLPFDLQNLKLLHEISKRIRSRSKGGVRWNKKNMGFPKFCLQADLNRYILFRFIVLLMWWLVMMCEVFESMLVTITHEDLHDGSK